MVPSGKLFCGASALTVIALVFASNGCGSTKTPLGGSGVDGEGSGNGDDGGSGSGSGSLGGGTVFSSGDGDASTTASSCSDGTLDCLVPANCTTTITGTVYDPAGANPLYNAVVYVPDSAAGTLQPIKVGTSTCETCNTSIGNYVAATTSAADGTFTLSGVPAGTHIPLVVQIGKWRREVFLPSVKACTNNPLAGSSMTRLPTKRSEGDLPQMAIVTGAADNLGCFLRGIGLDPSEYSAPHAGGRLDVYQGQGAGFNFFGTSGSGAPGLSTGTAGDCTSDNANCVWNSTANLQAYDIVLLACEGDTYDPAEGGNGPTNKTTTSKQALHDWLNEGGRVFATHFHYTWFKNSPDADFTGLATWLGSSNGGDSANYTVDTSFPKGMIFDQWLDNVQAATGTQIALNQVAESVGTVNAGTERWIYNPNDDKQGNNKNTKNDTKYFSFETPIGGAKIADAGESASPQYCGKAVFSDLHAGGSPEGNIPGVCAGPPLTPQLKALEFLFFDLSACVSDDTKTPPPPPPPTR